MLDRAHITRGNGRIGEKRVVAADTSHVLDALDIERELRDTAPSMGTMITRMVRFSSIGMSSTRNPERRYCA